MKILQSKVRGGDNFWLWLCIVLVLVIGYIVYYPHTAFGKETNKGPATVTEIRYKAGEVWMPMDSTQVPDRKIVKQMVCPICGECIPTYLMVWITDYVDSTGVSHSYRTFRHSFQCSNLNSMFSIECTEYEELHWGRMEDLWIIDSVICYGEDK